MTTVGNVKDLFTELVYILQTKNPFLLAPENNQKIVTNLLPLSSRFTWERVMLVSNQQLKEFQKLLFSTTKFWLVMYDCLLKMATCVCTGEYPHLCVGFKSKFRELEQSSVPLLKDLLFDKIEYYRFMHLWRPQKNDQFCDHSPLHPPPSKKQTNKKKQWTNETNFKTSTPFHVDVINVWSLLLFLWYKPSYQRYIGILLLESNITDVKGFVQFNSLIESYVFVRSRQCYENLKWFNLFNLWCITFSHLKKRFWFLVNIWTGQPSL